MLQVRTHLCGICLTFMHGHDDQIKFQYMPLCSQNDSEVEEGSSLEFKTLKVPRDMGRITFRNQTTEALCVCLYVPGTFTFYCYNGVQPGERYAPDFACSQLHKRVKLAQCVV